MDKIKVFIENEAGSNTKNTYNEKSLIFIKSEQVSAPYPFPYGFILNTTSGDGDNVDCFVVTDQQIKSGTTIDCEAIDLLEQVEDGEVDHKIIVVPAAEDISVVLSSEVEMVIRLFIQNVFSHVPGKKISVGQLLGPEAAKQFISANSDDDGTLE